MRSLPVYVLMSVTVGVILGAVMSAMPVKFCFSLPVAGSLSASALCVMV